MGRFRGRGGRFEEEAVGSLARLKELIADDDAEKAEKREAEEEAQAVEKARRGPVLHSYAPRGRERRYALTVTLAVSSLDALERLCTVRRESRGHVIDRLLKAAAEAEFGEGAGDTDQD